MPRRTGDTWLGIRKKRPSGIYDDIFVSLTPIADVLRRPPVSALRHLGIPDSISLFPLNREYRNARAESGNSQVNEQTLADVGVLGANFAHPTASKDVLWPVHPFCPLAVSADPMPTLP